MTLMCLPFKSKGQYTLPAAKDKKNSSRSSSKYSRSPASTPPPSIGGASNDAHSQFPPYQNGSAAREMERREPVFGGHVPVAESPEDIKIPRYSKDNSSRRLIEDGISNNDFLKNLDRVQINSVVDSMYVKEIMGNTLLIKEGDIGSHMYVAAEGKFEVSKEGQVLGEIKIGEVFGELALLYNAKRQASIRVLTKSKVWTLERKIFQQIMVRTGLKLREDNVRFLRSVPLFKQLQNEKVLAKISDLLRVEFYPTDHVIVRQGDLGETFYIISGGTVKITKKQPGSNEDVELGNLSRGDFFGELALLNNDRRQATITAMSPGVECLVLDREPFEKFLGPLDTIKNKWSHVTGPSRPSSDGKDAVMEFADVQLKDLEYVATLGVGGFGRVELVYLRKEKKTLALKCLKKVHVVEQQQEQHVYNEKRVMLECKNCPFIVKLCRTYKDRKYVYFLMEPCLGGDVFTMLQKRHLFDEQTARFMTACVVEAFAFLHERNFVYRDLKPENVMLDSRGYLKMIDFGFAKKIPHTSKTWTFAGTPEYVAPEIILGKGHDRAVDYWALGIFMHELLVGRPPFRGSDHMKTYNMILKGIDTVHFSKHISRDAGRLIKKLCRHVPTERLGYQRDGVDDIKRHPWLAKFNWEALRKGTLKAPINIQLNGPQDTRYFDKYPRNKEIPPDDFSGWDDKF